MSEGPNQCDGTTLLVGLASGKSSTVWFTVTCVVLGIIAVALFATIFAFSRREVPKPPSATYAPMPNGVSQDDMFADDRADR
jgi:hypothetical protein